MADKLFTPEQTAEITEIVNAALVENNEKISELTGKLSSMGTSVEEAETKISVLEEENKSLRKQMEALATADKTEGAPVAAPAAPKVTDEKPVTPTGTYKVKVKDGEEEKEVVVKFLKPGPFYMGEAKRQVTSEELAKPKNAALLAILVQNGSNIIEIVG